VAVAQLWIVRHHNTTSPYSMKTIIIPVTMTVLCYGLAIGQSTLTITFDGPPEQPPETQYVVTNYSESGMSFTSIPEYAGFGRNTGGISGYPDDGSDYIQPGPDTLVFSLTDGSLFGLDSVDLAGYSTVLPDFDVQFVGYHPDGSTVTAEFSGSGINFQTFSFTGFSDVSYVEIPINEGFLGEWSLDNLVVSTPEPSVGQFLLICGLLFCAAQLRRDSRPSET
jgi:hypothetical protein